MDEDRRPTIRERYSLASRASSLLVRADRSSSVDMLIAAGWIKECLATELYRLLSEFDIVRGDQRAARAEQDRLAREWADASKAAALESKRRQSEQDADFVGPPSGQHFMRAPGVIAAEAIRSATQARAFMFIELKSLPSVKQAIYSYADRQATQRGLTTVTPADVAHVTGKVLEVLLDPLCPVCEGRGFTGGFNGPQIWHQGKGSCNRSGRRHIELSRNPAAELFGQWLLADLERKAARVEGLMRKFLRQYFDGDDVPVRSDEAWAELRQRLVDLRSEEAAAD